MALTEDRNAARRTALRSRLEERDIRSSRARILHHLALAAGPDGRTVSLDGTLMDLAAEIGLTREVLYRTLAALEKDGTIARTRSGIVLKKITAVSSESYLVAPVSVMFAGSHFSERAA